MANEFVARNGFIAKANSTISGTLDVSGNITMGTALVATRSWVTGTALVGYATESYVNTAISNLTDSAPDLLNTLNELSAALGDDPNFATTITTSIGAKVAKAGDTMTGNLNWGTSDRGITWSMNTDAAYIKFFNTGDGDTNSRLEYATADNGNEFHRWMIATVEEMTLKSDGLRVTNDIWTGGNKVATETFVTTRGYLTAESDPIFVGSPAYNIEQTNIDKWDLAFGWGDHDGLYAAASHTHSATDITSGTLASARLSGNYAINVTGSAATLTTARTLTIGNTGKTFNGSANVSWSLAEIGAQPAGSYLTTEADTLATVTARGATTTGNIVINGEATIQNNGFLRLTAGASQISGFTVYNAALNGYLSNRVTTGDHARGWGWEFTTNEANNDTGSVYFRVGYNGAVSYLNSGNFGIGTTAPSSKLHIVTGTPTGAAAPSSDVPLLIDSSGHQFIEFRTASAASGLMQGTLYSDNGKNAFIGYKEYTGAAANTYGESIHIAIKDFSASDAGSGIYLGATSNPILGVTTPYMFIKGNGNVGIGTTSPSTKLHVNGVITATGGNSTNWNTAYNWGSHASAGYANYSHKYHTFSAGDEYYDSYGQNNNLRLFTENATFDNFRFRSYSNVEYFDGTNWVAWGQSLNTLFDGREETGISLGHANSHFRFEINRSSGWPTTALFVIQSSWTDTNSHTCEVTLETWNGSAWVQKDNWTYSDFQRGINLHTTTNVHDGNAQMRVTINMDWVDASHNYYPIRRILLLSNFSGTAYDMQPFTWDYGKNVTFASQIYVSGGNSSQWNTAYGWGDHDGLYAGIDTEQNLVDLTNSLGTAAYQDSTAFAAASHTHTIAQVTGLQTALNEKLSLTGGAVTGLTIFEDGLRIGTGNHSTDGRASITFGEGATTNDSMYIEYDGENLSGDNNAIIFGSIKEGVGDIFRVTYGGSVIATTFTGALSGNATTATTLATARTLTIGATGKNFNGSANVSWTLAEIGAQAAGSYAAASHTHAASAITQGTFTAGRYIIPYQNGITGSTAPNYSNGGLELYTDSNHVPTLSFHRGGVSATALYEYDGQLYVKPWTTRAQVGLLLSSGNIGAYADPVGAADAVNQRIDNEVIPAIPTDNSQLANGAGYITGYTETDTLASVTGRGATTSSKVFFTHNTTADPLSAVEINGGGNHTGLYINPTAAKQAHIRFGTNGTLKWQIRTPFQDAADTALKFYSWVSGDDKFVFNHNGSATFNGGTVWTSANDGSGSGLDADLLDGQQGSYYLDWTNVTNKPDPTITLAGAVTGAATMTDLGNITITTTATSDPVITLTGAVTGSGTMTNLGNVSITTTATSDPVLTLAGDATGSATFTNLGNATLTVTVVDDSHIHDGRYYTETESDARFVNVTGDTVTGNLVVSGASLGVISTSQGSEAFYVDGVNGRLFTINDDLSDSLFSVNTISGLPVIEAFADNRVNIGPFSNPVTVDTAGLLYIGGLQAATQSYVDTAITNLIGGAPGALDTLNELAAAIADDASYASTITSALALKAPLASPALTGTPTAPTAATATNTTQIATTAFVKAQGYLTSLGFNYGTGVTANYVVQRDANGYIYANYVNHNTSETENPAVNSFFVSNGDGWTRKATVAHVKSTLGLGSAAYTASTAYAAASHTHTIGDISDRQRLFNNMGNNHSAFTDFNSVSNFGPFFIQGTAGGPETGSSQYYGLALGLGNDYAYGSYAMQMAIPRYEEDDKYLTFRTRENGSWSEWVKFNAGYADSAGSLTSMNISQFTNNSGYITGYTETDTLATVIGRGAYFGTTNQGYVTANAGTYGSDIRKIRRITMTAGSSNWDNDNHCIISTDSAGNLADSLSLNSYNDITFRVDTNSNNNASYVRFGNHGTGSATYWFTSGYDGARYLTTHKGDILPGDDRIYDIGQEDQRWRIVFCETLDSAGLHETNLETEGTEELETGTVLVWKGGKNVPCSVEADHMRMGIAVHGHKAPLVQGAEPVLCIGEVNEGDYLITSTTVGHAKAVNRAYVVENQLFDCVLGKALETASGESHLVKTWITI